jgi:hypothetical protein
VLEQIAGWWCRTFHPEPMWPVCGHYRCPKCLRVFPVPWETPAAARKVVDTPRPAAPAVAATGKVLPWPIADNASPVVPGAPARQFGRVGSTL